MFIDEHHLVNYPGGVEKVLAAFSNEFVERGYEVSIVGMDNTKGTLLYPLDNRVQFINLWYLPDEPALGGFLYFLKKIQKELLRAIAGRKLTFVGHTFQDPKQEYFFAEFIRRLQGCIEEQKPDVVLAVTPDSAYLAQRAMGNKNIPIIGMCHSETTNIQERLTERQLTAWQKCQTVQVLLPAFVEDVKRCGIKNVISIPNAVEQVPDDQVRNLDDCYHKIVMIGRLDGGNKRHHLLIESFALIADRYPEWNVYIYGNADNKRYERKLKHMIEQYHMQNRIFLCGVSTDIPAILQQTDIFVFPSEHEGFGLTLVEAMSIGIPVIACKDCIAARAILGNGHTGILSEPTPMGISLSVIELMKSVGMRKELGRIAHDTVRRYGPRTVWDKWVMAIQAVQRK